MLWLLEELNLPYEIKFYERNKATMLAPPELSAVHPLGKSPVVTDGELVVAESGAILEYLVDRYGQGRLKPAGHTPEALLRYRYWMHYAEGSVMPPLLMKLIFDRIERGPMPFFVKPIAKGIAAKVKGGFIQPSIDRHFNFIEAELGKSAWFAGDEFTAADVQMSFPLEAAAARGGPAAKQPRVTDFLKRIHARPAYQQALARGGPYALMS